MTAACLDCAGHDVHWFTPPSKSGEGGVFVCRRCGRVNIVSLRATRSSRRRAESTARAA